MIDCPNCHRPMDARTLAAQGGAGGSVDVNGCPDCGVLWFDAQESMRLVPQSVLDLFRYIGEAGKARNTLAASFGCPRCRRRLLYTHDLQRTTRFTYWRCTDGHGRLITFHQFLAEKNFLRPPSAAELARLRETIRQVSCSQCGAPVDLRKDSACPHCGTPVALIDSDSVAKAVQSLAVAATPAATDPHTLRTALGDAQIDALFDLERMRTRERDGDLLAAAASGLAALLGALDVKTGPG